MLLLFCETYTSSRRRELSPRFFQFVSISSLLPAKFKRTYLNLDSFRLTNNKTTSNDYMVEKSQANLCSSLERMWLTIHIVYQRTTKYCIFLLKYTRDTCSADKKWQGTEMDRHYSCIENLKRWSQSVSSLEILPLFAGNQTTLTFEDELSSYT